MPRRAGNSDQAVSSQGEARDGDSRESIRLLRCSHIFSSAIREVLEVKLLEEVSPFPLTLSQFQLLKLMSINGQHQVGEMADFIGVTPPAATKNIDKLEGLGLVIRTPSKGDRRAMLLSVSPKGRRLVRKYEEHRAARLCPVLKAFQPQEIEQLTNLLERFSLSLLGLEESADRFCLRCAAYIEEDCLVGRTRGGCPYRKARESRPSEGTKKP